MFTDLKESVHEGIHVDGPSTAVPKVAEGSNKTTRAACHLLLNLLVQFLLQHRPLLLRILCPARPLVRAPFQELSFHHAAVPLRQLEDGDGVILQEVLDDELPVNVFDPRIGELGAEPQSLKRREKREERREKREERREKREE